VKGLKFVGHFKKLILILGAKKGGNFAKKAAAFFIF